MHTNGKEWQPPAGSKRPYKPEDALLASLASLKAELGTLQRNFHAEVEKKREENVLY